MNEQQERILRELDSASDALKKALPTGTGGVGNEKRYGSAYQAAVTAGIKPQIKRKYR